MPGGEENGIDRNLTGRLRSSGHVSDRRCGRTGASRESHRRTRGSSLLFHRSSLSPHIYASALAAVYRSFVDTRLFKHAARRNRAHDWRIKSLSSYRRLPLPGFLPPTYPAAYQSEVPRRQELVRHALLLALASCMRLNSEETFYGGLDTT